MDTPKKQVGEDAADLLPKLIDRAEVNLDRQLAWIERYDSRSSIVLGVCIGMLGFLAVSAPSFPLWDRASYMLAGGTLLLIGRSLVALYSGHYPRTESPNDSLVYFGTIASLKIDTFVDKFCKLDDEDYLRDLCHQTHINAVIISKKFSCLKTALIFMLLAILPWAGSIAWFRVLAPN